MGSFGPYGDLDPWSLIEEFTSVIGHELRTPLAIVKAAAETCIARNEELDVEGMRKLLETIVRNSDLALLLVDRIGPARDFENGTVELVREPIDLAVLVAESVGDLGHVVLQDHPIEVSGASSLVVSGDPAALREIVFNLLANAAKHSAPDARIEVTVSQHQDVAEVIVRDHGTGVTAGDTETIFGKFYQADPTLPGVGLGLYISRGLARAHEGDLRVQPAEQQGSEFILTLPA